MKRFVLAILAVSLASSSFGFVITKNWLRTFSPPGATNFFPQTMLRDSAGNTYHIGGGTVGGVGAGCVTKLNAAGTVLQSYICPLAGSTFTSGILAPNGRIYLCGSTGGAASSMMAVCIESSNMGGSHSWPDIGLGVGIRTYHGPGTGTELARAILRGPDGDIYVTGQCRGFANADIATFRLTQSGNFSPSWPDIDFGVGVRRFSGPGNGFDEGKLLGLGSTGDLFVAASVNVGSADSDWYVFRFSNNGDLSSNWPSMGDGNGIRRFAKNPGEADTIQGSMIVEGSSNVYLCGYSNVSALSSHGEVVKIGTAGVLWNYESASANATTDISIDAYGHLGVVQNNGQLVLLTASTGSPSLDWPNVGSGVGIRTMSGGTNPTAIRMTFDSAGNAFTCGSCLSGGLTRALFLPFTRDGVAGTPDIVDPGIAPAAFRILESGGLISVGGYLGSNGSRSGFALQYQRFRLQGNVLLQGWDGDPSDVPMVIEFRDPENGALLESQAFRIDRDGNFMLDSNLLGRYDIAVKGSHFLRQTLRMVTFGAEGVNLNFSLLTGDCNNDNAVDIGDYSLLSRLFGLDSSSGDYDFDVDLNGDRFIDVGDYALLSQNYGMFGDD